MKTNHKSLNKHIDCGPLDLDHVANMRMEFFERMDYDWWGQVQPDDVVVDVGACVGLFTCLALDKGAKKVYSIEPNRELLLLTIKNAFDYIANSKESPVVPIHAAIGESEKHAKHVYEGGSEFPMITFNQLIDKYDISKIDYLKVDCEGGEYSFLNAKNLEWISNNVGHMAMEIHLRATESGALDFLKFRDEFLKHFFDQGKVHFMHNVYSKTIWDDHAILSKDHSKVPAEFMIYIKNKR